MAATRTDVIKAASIVAGIAAALAIDPDTIVNYSIDTAAKIAVTVSSPTPPPPPPSQSILDRVGRAIDAVDTFFTEAQYAVSWRERLIEFDESSPVDHRTIVRLGTAIVAVVGTRLLLSTLMR